MAIAAAVVRVLLSLGLALLLVYLFVGRLLPKLGVPRLAARTGMRVVDRIHLSRTHEICLVRVLHRYYLLALSPAGVKSLGVIDAEVVHPSYGAEAPSGTARSGVSSLFPWRKSRDDEPDA